MLKCRSCGCEIREGWFLCYTCTKSGMSIEDIEAGEQILNRVLAGLCQNCGQNATSCECVYVEISYGVV